jgi:hypothetical protein
VARAAGPDPRRDVAAGRAAALYVDEERIFTDFVDWTVGVLAAQGVPAAGLRVVGELLGDFPRATTVLDTGVARAVDQEQVAGG